jgi:hypothetical protein
MRTRVNTNERRKITAAMVKAIDDTYDNAALYGIPRDVIDGTLPEDADAISVDHMETA